MQPTGETQTHGEQVEAQASRAWLTDMRPMGAILLPSLPKMRQGCAAGLPPVTCLNTAPSCGLEGKQAGQGSRVGRAVDGVGRLCPRSM